MPPAPTGDLRHRDAARDAVDGDVGIGARARRPTTSSDSERRQQWRERQRRQNARRDPLTSAVFDSAVTPLLLLLLALFHAGYYLWLRSRAVVRAQQASVQQLRTRGLHTTQRWAQSANGVSLTVARNAAAEIALVQLGNAVRSQARLNGTADATSESLQALKQRKARPLRHFALAIGHKPMHTSTLLAQALIKLFRRGRESHGRDRQQQQSRRAAQLDFAVGNVRAALRYCALAGIPELTVFDEYGHLCQALLSADPDGAALMEQSMLIGGFEAGADPAAPFHGDREAHPSLAPMGIASLTNRDRKSNSDGLLVEESDQILLRIETRIQRPFQDVSARPHALHKTQSLATLSDGGADAVLSIRLNVLGPSDAQGAIAGAASVLAAKRTESGLEKPISVDAITEALARQGYPSEPDVVMIHGGLRHVSTLHGFPPWLVKLCEIVHDTDAPPDEAVSAVSFERAVHQFLSSEQRFGK